VIRAPAKLNLCLYLGPRRGDGLHELRSLFAPLTLADRVVVAEAERDSVRCPGLEGPNLAGAALSALRERGWTEGPLEVTIEKRIPVAAGLGGGSADAAAVLRLAADEIEDLEEIANSLGADVPSQLDPRFALVGGAGERIEPLPEPGEFAVVMIPDERGLATSEVYGEADRLGVGRGAEELEEIEERLRTAAARGASPLAYSELLRNDLERAALSLRPEVGDVLEALRETGAEASFVTGSGPTAVGLFADLPRADRAASSLSPRFAGAIVAAPEAYRQGVGAR
jgi:4-diphosphocytidyl-2-C-methyl-D-erythritol kinase